MIRILRPNDHDHTSQDNDSAILKFIKGLENEYQQTQVGNGFPFHAFSWDTQLSTKLFNTNHYKFDLRKMLLWHFNNVLVKYNGCWSNWQLIVDYHGSFR